MKRILFLTICFSLFLGGTAFAQSADEVYIKAMQAKDAAEKTKLLKEYVSLYAGKGNKYDNYAYAYLCLLQYQAKQYDADTISLAEKAIAAGGIDDMMKGSLLLRHRRHQPEKRTNSIKLKPPPSRSSSTPTLPRARKPKRPTPKHGP